MKYLILLLFISLFILKLSSSKQVKSNKNQTAFIIYLFSPRHLYKPTKARRLGKSYIGKGMGSQGKGRKQEEKSHWKREEIRNFHQGQKQLLLDKALSFLVMLVILLTLELWETQAQAALMAPKWFSKTRKLLLRSKLINVESYNNNFQSWKQETVFDCRQQDNLCFCTKRTKDSNLYKLFWQDLWCTLQGQYKLFRVVNLKLINWFVFRLLMVLILFLSQDQNQRPYMTGFILVMTVSGLIWTK